MAKNGNPDTLCALSDAEHDYHLQAHGTCSECGAVDWCLGTVRCDGDVTHERCDFERDNVQAYWNGSEFGVTCPSCSGVAILLELA